MASHVEYQHPTFASHVQAPNLCKSCWGKKSIHTDNRSVASESCYRPSPTSASHVGDVQPTTASHAGGIDSVEKPRRIGCKPKFPCNICKGDHLTHLCPGLPEVRRLWSLSASSSDSKSFEVSLQLIQPVVEKVVTSM
jgi:hypothetical protein